MQSECPLRCAINGFLCITTKNHFCKPTDENDALFKNFLKKLKKKVNEKYVTTIFRSFLYATAKLYTKIN